MNGVGRRIFPALADASIQAAVLHGFRPRMIVLMPK